jgi:hypothetical protein
MSKNLTIEVQEENGQMEIRKEDFQYVEWDDSIKSLRVIKSKRKRKLSVHAFTTSFHRKLIEQKSTIAFFIYYGLAGICAVAIVLSTFELTEDKLDWTGSLLPYLGVSILAIISSFLISRLVIKFVFLVLNLTVRMFRKNTQRTISNDNTEVLVDFIKINRPSRTPFPEELDLDIVG